MARTGKEQESKLSQRVTIRLSGQEYEAVARLAEKNRCTFSQAVRLFMFKNISESSENISDETKASLTLKHARAIRKNSDKITADIASINESYQRSVTLKNRAGEPAITTERTIDLLDGVMTRQDQLIDAVNQFLVAIGEKPKASSKEKKGKTDSLPVSDKLIPFAGRINGIVTSAPEKVLVLNKSGFSFVVTLSETITGTRYTYSVRVFIATDAVEKVPAKGEKVCAQGELHLEMRQKPVPSLHISLYAKTMTIEK